MAATERHIRGLVRRKHDQSKTAPRPAATGSIVEFDAVEAVLKQAGKVKTISADRALSSDEKREQLRRLLFPQAFADPPA